jgi:hypothetical protein
MGPDPDLDTDWYEIQHKMLDPASDEINPDPESMNPDLKHCKHCF